MGETIRFPIERRGKAATIPGNVAIIRAKPECRAPHPLHELCDQLDMLALKIRAARPKDRALLANSIRLVVEELRVYD